MRGKSKSSQDDKGAACFMEPLPRRVNAKDASEFFSTRQLPEKASDEAAFLAPAPICTILALTI
ncbi:hypothetical protein [Mixta gaviniae]|uniref:hypothetical protein n=1 Tax=Mixta gaviniae TaxID=665914 RepID=UPI0011AFF9C9|nr:hypothetical protein [Mixta gaviniae]